MALAVAASAIVERAKESECLLFVSKPPTIFFLLINLLTPLYCVRFRGKVEGECAAGGERRRQLASRVLKLED